jgi:hypothetical protein
MGERGGEAAQLLVQHEHLRALTIDLVQAARTIMTDGMTPLRGLVHRLADALAAHNRAEERVLEPMLLSSDRWSSVRIAEMMRDHRQEHEAFLADLRLVGGTQEPSIDLEARVFELAAAIHQHMDLEEIEYLNVRVVRDDVPVSRR